VADHQRARIVDAVAGVIAEGGYKAATVEHVITRAGVSRRTFYDHFSDRDVAFVAAYEAASARLLEAVRSAPPPASDDFIAGVRCVLETLVDFLLAEQALALLIIVEVMASGVEGTARRAQTLGEFIRMLERFAAAKLPDTDQGFDTSLIGETVVGGINEVIATRIRDGQIDVLPELLPELLYSAVVSYVGFEEAEAAKQAMREGR